MSNGETRRLEWTIDGSEGLPIHGESHLPPEGEPVRACAVLVHGWTGSKDRNFLPPLAEELARGGVVAHRFTLSHAGVEKDADRITRLEEFERDSNAFCVADVRAVVERIASGELAGAGAPMVLVGHSRGGATVYRCAAASLGAEVDGDVHSPWPIAPAGVISLSATATFTRLTDEMRAELEEKGFVERPLERAEGGAVRMGRSWYRHHLENPGRDLFAEAVAGVRRPCLVVHAAADDAVPIEHAATIMSLLEKNPHAPAERADVPDANHVFNVNGFRLTPEEASETGGDAYRRMVDLVEEGIEKMAARGPVGE